MVKLSRIWPMEAPSGQLLCPFDMFPLSSSLLWDTKYSSIACTSLPQTWNQLFPPKVKVPFSGKWYLGNWIKGYSYWLWDIIVSRSCLWTEWGNTPEQGNEFQLKYNITEFFLTLPHCKAVSENTGSQEHGYIFIFSVLQLRKIYL